MLLKCFKQSLSLFVLVLDLLILQFIFQNILYASNFSTTNTPAVFVTTATDATTVSTSIINIR